MIAATLAVLLAAATPTRIDAPPVRAVKLILVGDSTVAVGSGWGGAFCAAHVKSSVACLDLARGGRSTRSYRQEGSWAIALAEARVPGYAATYVLIQFGHNDQSSAPERWTDRTIEFPTNLRRYVAEVRSVGAVPVLVTPLSRREFRNAKLENTLLPWAAEVRSVAKSTQTPLLDLNAESAAMIQQAGAPAATGWAMAAPLERELAAARAGTTLPPRPVKAARLPDPPSAPGGPNGRTVRKFDYTHLGATGADIVARVITDELAHAVPTLRGELIP